MLVQLRDHDLLAGLDLFQRYKLALGLLFLGTVQQLLCILAGNFAGAHSTGGGVGLFIFLDAAQLVRQAYAWFCTSCISSWALRRVASILFSSIKTQSRAAQRIDGLRLLLLY